jgi:hypothetical protein
MSPRNWFRSYMASQTITPSGRYAPKRRPRCRLAMEMLEDRTVPTASISIADAASSFRLSSSNSNPQDLVTDGTSFWVVDGGNLKVFKYKLSGKSLGSWTIDPANAHPTGITINPNNVSDIWIVDNGTDKVYQYSGAAGRTSGSQNAAATFALAPGNTNPQGIADPPPPDMLLTKPVSSLAVTPPSLSAFNATASSGMPIVAAFPALAGRDAVFAMLAPESFQSLGTPSINLMAGGQKSVDQPIPLTPVTSQRLRSQSSALGLLDGTLTDEEIQPSAALRARGGGRLPLRGRRV